jgi:hypothetical protein
LRKADMHPAPTRTEADGTVICCFAWNADPASASEELRGVASAVWQQAQRGIARLRIIATARRLRAA